MESHDNVASLTLPEIASWQIDLTQKSQGSQFVAELPALQRGSVWKPEQIETLWDSIIQGFPVGSFLLSPYDANLGTQRFKHATKDTLHPTHMLLDGQQRATGIALGFLNPWRNTSPDEEVKSVLWVDLAVPPKGRDVDFVFRVITRSHPWGYSRSNPIDRISQQQIRDSLRAFKKANAPLFDDLKPHKIPLRAVWPWDAVAPIPVSILIEALRIKNGDIETSMQHARSSLDNLAFMKLPETDDGNPDTLPKHWKNQHDGVCAAFDQASDLHERLKNLLSTLNDRISSKYVIPASIIPTHALNNTANNDQDESRSPVESLFIRINSAGTPLAGEELMYSLIKSAWIEAPDAIAKLTHRLATPARTALLASRLVRARNQRKRWIERQDGENFTMRLPGTPSVDEFRRWMHGMNQDQPGFAKELQDYIQKEGLHVFEMARQFLTEGDYGLPVVLANELAQKSQDVFFLLLYWLERMIENKLDPLSNENNRRRAIGFVTALSWFSRTDSKPRAVDAIWHDLQKIDSKSLPDFFDRKRFLKTMEIDKKGRQHMIPLVSPDTLEMALRKKILGYQGCTNTISADDSDIWMDWNWWSSLIDQGRPKDIDKELAPYFSKENREDEDDESVSVSDRARDSWGQFMSILYENKSMLIYAQRQWINDWFSDFDPSLPEFIEDKNRPWDYDHIHPQNLLRGRNGGTLQRLPKILTYWHQSIGNLRAWPLEANRSDGDDSPSKKLREATKEEKRYEISDENKIGASLIDENDFKLYWDNCTPRDDIRLNNVLSRKEQRALINAIIWRFLAIYRKWYEDLKISTLSLTQRRE